MKKLTSRQEFRNIANPISISIDNIHELEADLREFKTGALGWYLSKKVKILIDDVEIPVQINLNIIVSKSNDLPEI